MTAEKLIPEAVDSSKIIHGKSFTVGWLLDSLKTKDKTYQKFHRDRVVKEITNYDVSGGKGFLSQVLRFTISFVDSVDAQDVYHTIVKVPGIECIEDTMKKCDYDFEELEKKEETPKDKHAFIVDSHKFECDFYNNLAPILDVPCPKVYATREMVLDETEGYIHMEDLTLRGKTISFFENINLTQVKLMIRTLAHMHKNILSADPESWHGKYLKNQEAMVGISKAMEMMTAPLIKLSKRQEALESLVARMKGLVSNTDFATYSNKQAHIDLGMKPVLVHGDMHAGNIMWAIDEEGNTQNELAALVDWQIMHEGSPMSDLARFLTHCADGVVRRQAEAFACEYYLECLTAEFGGDTSKVPYTLEQLQKAYNYAYITQSFAAVALTYMLYAANEDKYSPYLNQTFLDYGVQKAIHLLEDTDRLLQGDMKQVLEKYGV